MKVLLTIVTLIFTTAHALDLQFDAFESGPNTTPDYSDNRFGAQTRYASFLTNFSETRLGVKPSLRMAGVEIGALVEYVHGEKGVGIRTYSLDDSNYLHWTPYIRNGEWLWYQFSLDENANIEVRVGFELFKNQSN